MPTTSNFGWTTPADTDLVKDGAAAIRTLGNGIDTSLVDLKGGTTGQVLAKASNTDLDFTWTNGGDITEVTAGTGLSGGGTSGAVTLTNTVATTFDAKGDLVVGTGADTFSKLTVGANNTVLTADSSTATGLKWAAPTAPATCGVGVYNTTDISAANGADVVVTFNSEHFDTDAFHSTSTNTSRLTVPSGKGGYYYIYANPVWSSNTSSYRQIKFRKNGTNEFAEFRFQPVGGSSETVPTAFTVENLVAGDYVELVLVQWSGTSLTIMGSNGTRYRFGMIRIGE